MNDQKIFELMAKTPGIRAVQIADALDAELVDVSAAMRSLVEVGDVVQSKGFSPNGHPAQIYDLSEAFKKSKEGLAILAAVTPKAEPAPLAVPVFAKPAPPAPAPVATPVFVPAAQPPTIGAGPSIADLGIAYIVKHGAVSQEDLRIAMRLGKGIYPSSYLLSAIRSGKVHKDGNFWKPGAAPATKDATPIPQAVVDAIEAAPAPVALAVAGKPTARCITWLELQREDGTLLRLSADEAGAVYECMAERWRA